ncbi:MAG: hypothetical protein L0177_03485, partial [Chloroflexi bacterium]|nr:hypothetical protein [Chloroflexota bacterium]
AAAEACFIALKLHPVFEPHIDSSNSRKEVREHTEGMGKSLFHICAGKQFRGSLEQLFRSNADLIEANAERYSKVVKLVEGANPDGLRSMAQSFQRLFGVRFTTTYSYMGIVDPAELDAVISRMNTDAAAMRASTAEAQRLFESASAPAEGAMAAYEEAMSVLSSMKASVEQARDALLSPGHFARDLVDAGVIEGLLRGELRQAALSVRENLANALGSEQLESLLSEEVDRHRIAGAEAVIQQADLLSLEAERKRVDAHIKRLSSMISEVTRQIGYAEQVPGENARRFRELASLLYPLSCIPVLGFIAAWVLLWKTDQFASAFASANRAYRELGAELVERSARFRKINTYVVINVIAGILLAQALKRLTSYMGRDGRALESERRVTGD